MTSSGAAGMRRPVQFSVNDACIHGMLDMPMVAHAPPSVGVVMLNSDDGCRLGPNRLWVRLAEQLRGEGYPCLRFDYRGCGDSEGPEGPSPAGHALADTIAAEWHLREQTGVRHTILIGICYGAEVALLAGQCIHTVQGVVACSTGRYVTGQSPSGVLREARICLRGYGRMLFSWSTWWKLLRGQVHVRLIISSVWSVLSRTNRQRSYDGAATARAQVGDVVRKVPSLFIYGTDDCLTASYMPTYRHEAQVLGLQRHFHLIAGADHNFSSVSWSEDVIRQASSFVRSVADTMEEARS